MTEARAPAAAARPLGILACAGPLPIEIAEAALRQGRPVHIVAIDGFASEAVARFPHERVSLGQVGRILASFQRADVAEIVIAGAMVRPNLLTLRIDWGFVRSLPTVLALTKGGDDSVLRRVIRFFEGHGLAVVGAGEVAPALLAPAGAMTQAAPCSEAHRALARGAALIAALGPFDIGQGVVAGDEGVIAVEGVRGTDAMLRDLGPDGVGEGLARGGVLVKLAKPGQEMRIDLPTIGPETVRKATAAGLSGIAVGAGAAIVLGRAEVAALGDAAGLFVVGLEIGGGRPGGAPPDEQAPISTPAERSLVVAARRAPTPADRRDIGIGRRLMAVLREHDAGIGAIISREHVLAVSARLPLPAVVAAQGRPASWGRRALRGRLGVLVVDGGRTSAPSAAELLTAPLFRTALQCGLAGVVLLGELPGGEAGEAIRAWADEAGVFLMAEGLPA